jgi:hypothetical protein
MSKNNSIINFKKGFNGGTRANRFKVIPQWPSDVSVSNKDSSFKIVSASLPATTINNISVPYRGRQISFPGDRMYSTWTVGVYDDNNTDNLWRGFQKWAELMDGHYTHTVYKNNYSYSELQTTWTIKQLDLNGDTLKTIILYKCWPSVVGEINLNMAEVGIVGFSTTLTFDYINISDKEGYNKL